MALEVQRCFHDDPYDKEEIAKLLDISVSELETGILSENTRDVPQFKLKQRALHVFEGSLIRIDAVQPTNDLQHSFNFF